MRINSEKLLFRSGVRLELDFLEIRLNRDKGGEQNGVYVLHMCVCTLTSELEPVRQSGSGPTGPDGKLIRPDETGFLPV